MPGYEPSVVNSSAETSLLAPAVPETAHRLYLASLMFLRQRQLHDGARPRVDARGHGPVRVALLEGLAGLILDHPENGNTHLSWRAGMRR